ncbi:MAG: MurR/RpiR family transcriptional regulator [Polaromonas sp.]|uniref:MurR/RpiR family transcriptional regulator n=1 Tax=Polaromonas sp. TaxID=1869339 RepID=UPI0027321616|nr:MurR/RpiR family transcriptional regulator [Polaromonas sp.]MDP1742532.1 MurR/RpiR family transcriptional regulator [Polaromonas sp.]MDP1952912.1 MurR/RpiR family transcriptional regulator [Polaromonas sp.]MDP3249782.1 MurR/RpiR family transcriptional regulator [Polaromonas sp.]MDP3752407.1 MurR/RpiR family transcriptional regulator [Polaromonas sp.]
MSAPALFADVPLDGLSPELLRAARWVEAHPREVALHSMRECARRADMAPATLSRLAQALGFSGFDAIKHICQESFAARGGYAGRAEVLQASARHRADWLAILNETQHANTASISGLNQRVQLEAAADAMLAARCVHFLGLRASHGLALHLHYSYGLLASNGQLVQGVGGTLSDQIDEIRAGDLLVAMSLAPYTRQTVDAVNQALGQGVDLLVLTDSALSPIARSATHTLLFRADSPSYFQSMVGALALAEALAAAVAVRGGRKVLAHLQARQDRLESEGAYWDKRADKPGLARPSHSSARK